MLLWQTRAVTLRTGTVVNDVVLPDTALFRILVGLRTQSKYLGFFQLRSTRGAATLSLAAGENRHTPDRYSTLHAQARELPLWSKGVNANRVSTIALAASIAQSIKQLSVCLFVSLPRLYYVWLMQLWLIRSAPTRPAHVSARLSKRRYFLLLFLQSMLLSFL